MPATSWHKMVTLVSRRLLFAQNYFAVQTRVAEVIEQRLLDYDRVQARHKLAETEKRLSGVLYERGVDDKGFGIIRSKGDQALFRMNTAMLKRKLGAPEKRCFGRFLCQLLALRQRTLLPR